VSHAKQLGHGMLQVFDAALKTLTEQRSALGVDLAQAIQRNELVVHFQPQVDASSASGRVRGMEALVRWQHPQMGLIEPHQFVPIAEETPLIIAIGKWVLNEACRTLRDWRDAGLEDVTMGINLSAVQLRHPNLFQDVSQAIARHGLTGQDLELELTESVAMSDPKANTEVLRKLRTLGVRLAIDDFGTGHSSLSYLKLLPLQTLKLDRSFVQDTESDVNDAAICKATIALAHKLKLAVVAEGVETAAQCAYLRSCGCDMLQGFWFSKPCTSAQALAYALSANPH
jgi:EAL domain-containing protein (putative c-di-GMP-specific phosphodiesterase class I)